MEENLIQLVLEMKSNNYTNDQIIQHLQLQGYESQQIYDSITAAELRSGRPVQEEQHMGKQESYDISQPPQENLQMSSVRDEIEAVAESIIDEKWAEFEDSVKKILDWKAEVATRIEGFTKEVEDLKHNMMNLQKGLFGKINEYDKSIVNVGTEIKALEKVFKDILPTLTDNVQELSRITTKLKK